MGRAFTFLLTLATGAALAQPLGAVRDSRNAGSSNAAPAAARPLAAQPAREPAAERCQNLRRELRQVTRREREARTTGEADQFALRHQQLLEQSSRAGC